MRTLLIDRASDLPSCTCQRRIVRWSLCQSKLSTLKSIFCSSSFFLSRRGGAEAVKTSQTSFRFCLRMICYDGSLSWSAWLVISDMMPACEQLWWCWRDGSFDPGLQPIVRGFKMWRGALLKPFATNLNILPIGNAAIHIILIPYL